MYKFDTKPVLIIETLKYIIERFIEELSFQAYI